MSDEERIARALCAFDGHRAHIMFRGIPMWRSYLPQARAVIAALGDRLRHDGEPTI